MFSVSSWHMYSKRKQQIVLYVIIKIDKENQRQKLPRKQANKMKLSSEKVFPKLDVGTTVKISIHGI